MIGAWIILLWKPPLHSCVPWLECWRLFLSPETDSRMSSLLPYLSQAFLSILSPLPCLLSTFVCSPDIECPFPDRGRQRIDSTKHPHNEMENLGFVPHSVVVIINAQMRHANIFNNDWHICWSVLMEKSILDVILGNHYTKMSAVVWNSIFSSASIQPIF